MPRHEADLRVAPNPSAPSLGRGHRSMADRSGKKRAFTRAAGYLDRPAPLKKENEAPDDEKVADPALHIAQRIESCVASLSRLTARERSVLRLFMAHLHDKGVARELGISNSTVRNQMALIMAKLGATSRLDLVMTVMSLAFDDRPRS